MDNKTKKCFCCDNEIKDGDQVCSKCGALMPAEIDPVAYKHNMKAQGWSAIIGLIVGFFTSLIFGGIDPNSYLFLVGVLLGFGSAYLTRVCFDKYYKNQATLTKAKPSQRVLSRERKWAAQEKN